MHTSLPTLMAFTLSFYALLLTCDKEQPKILRTEKPGPQGTVVTYTFPDGKPISSYIIGAPIYQSAGSTTIYTICQLQALCEQQQKQQ